MNIFQHFHQSHKQYIRRRNSTVIRKNSGTLYQSFHQPVQLSTFTGTKAFSNYFSVSWYVTHFNDFCEKVWYLISLKSRKLYTMSVMGCYSWGSNDAQRFIFRVGWLIEWGGKSCMYTYLTQLITMGVARVVSVSKWAIYKTTKKNLGIDRI